MRSPLPLPVAIQVPVADFLNHAAPTHANTDAQWRASTPAAGGAAGGGSAAGGDGAAAGGLAAGEYTVVTRQPVAAGGELLISYGAHDDALLLSQVLTLALALILTLT